MVAARMKASGALVQPVPPSHSHAAALRDRARARTSTSEANTSPEQARSRVAERIQQIKERLARQPAPSAGLYTRYSGRTGHLSRVTRLARASGRKDAEVLNAQAQLIEDWLEAQREVAQQSLAVLRQVPGIQIEPAFRHAYTALRCRRTESYATKPFLFEDTEALANAVKRYTHVMTGPHRSRLRVVRAEAKLSEHDPSSNTQAAHRAQRRLARAKVHVSPRIQAIQRWRIDKARQEMTQACEALEKNFKMELPEDITSTSGMNSNAETGAGQHSGHWELKFRRAKPSM
ncbi:plasmid mobilization protein [Pseudoxanthomonas sp. UC19_8]|uniref:plasmid mobilization protein n=1 Tax=Pseudoxanthomonas sp. UC19_8 TaxID=3350175 RepID=UPI0036D2A6E6